MEKERKKPPVSSKYFRYSVYRERLYGNRRSSRFPFYSSVRKTTPADITMCMCFRMYIDVNISCAYPCDAQRKRAATHRYDQIGSRNGFLGQNSVKKAGNKFGRRTGRIKPNYRSSYFSSLSNLKSDDLGTSRTKL